MMKQKSVNQLGFLISEIDAVYHEASVKLGLSDSALQILYALYLNGNHCLLSDITKLCGVSRKTIHSSTKKLEDEGIIFVKPYNGRNKCVQLTEKGESIVNSKVVPLIQIENEIISSWKPEEQEIYLRLMQRYCADLKEKVRNRL